MSWSDHELPPVPTGPDAVKEMQRHFVRCFNSNSGAAVLAALRQKTLDHVLSRKATDADLRWHEGQRSLVQYILHQIELGVQE
jgi:hypothetical protein